MVIQCGQCQKDFTRQSSLNRHTRSKHNVTSATQHCNICSKTFARRDNLRRHEQKYHNNNGVAHRQVVAASPTAGPSHIVNSLNDPSPFPQHNESKTDDFVIDDNWIDTIDPTWWLSDNIDVDDDLLLGLNVVDTNQFQPSSPWGLHGPYKDPMNLVKNNQHRWTDVPGTQSGMIDVAWPAHLPGTGVGSPYWSATADPTPLRRFETISFDVKADSINTPGDIRPGNTFDASSSLVGPDTDMRPNSTWYNQPG